MLSCSRFLHHRLSSKRQPGSLHYTFKILKTDTASFLTLTLDPAIRLKNHILQDVIWHVFSQLLGNPSKVRQCNGSRSTVRKQPICCFDLFCIALLSVFIFLVVLVRPLVLGMYCDCGV